MMRLAVPLAALAILAAGCGGGGTPTPTEPDVLATPSEVEQIVWENDTGAQQAERAGVPYSVECTGLDSEGRTFSCVGYIHPPAMTMNDPTFKLPYANYEVACDGESCTWETYQR